MDHFLHYLINYTFFLRVGAIVIDLVIKYKFNAVLDEAGVIFEEVIRKKVNPVTTVVMQSVVLPLYDITDTPHRCSQTS
jgi:hypothetical protein